MKAILLWICKVFGVGFLYLDRNLVRQAEQVVIEVESVPGVISGDYRRAVALGKLLKRNPGVSKRDAAMAIEYVIRQGVI